jgi:hypothetical protein
MKRFYTLTLILIAIATTGCNKEEEIPPVIIADEIKDCLDAKGNYSIRYDEWDKHYESYCFIEAKIINEKIFNY